MKVYILLFRRFWKMSETVNGGLAGMVSVCCGCDGFSPWTACLVGAVGGAIYVLVATVMVKIKVDDPVNAVAVHGGGGLWGLLAGPIFRSNGLLSLDHSADGLKMLMWNCIGMAAIVGRALDLSPSAELLKFMFTPAWYGVTSIILFGSLFKLGFLRVKKSVEVAGLDVLKHDEKAYPECETY